MLQQKERGEPMEVKIDSDKLCELVKWAKFAVTCDAGKSISILRMKELSDENDRLTTEVDRLAKLNLQRVDSISKLRTELKNASYLEDECYVHTKANRALITERDKLREDLKRTRKQRTSARRNFNEILGRIVDLYESCGRSADYIKYSAAELDPANEE